MFSGKKRPSNRWLSGARTVEKYEGTLVGRDQGSHRGPGPLWPHRDEDAAFRVIPTLALNRELCSRETSSVGITIPSCPLPGGSPAVMKRWGHEVVSVERTSIWEGFPHTLASSSLFVRCSNEFASVFLLSQVLYGDKDYFLIIATSVLP